MPAKLTFIQSAPLHEAPRIPSKRSLSRLRRIGSGRHRGRDGRRGRRRGASAGGGERRHPVYREGADPRRRAREGGRRQARPQRRGGPRARRQHFGHGPGDAPDRAGGPDGAQDSRDRGRRH